MHIQPAVVVSAAVAFAGVWLGVERAAAAQAHGAPRLELVAPPTCPSEATVRDEVGLLTGVPTSVPADPFNSRSKDVLRVALERTERARSLSSVP
jgi:hypothetical protein